MNQYKRIYDTLSEFVSIGRRFEQRRVAVEEWYAQELAALDNSIEMKIEDINAAKRELEAYSNIAKTQARGIRLIPETVGRPLDKGKLARLAVQLSGGSSQIAVELYREATGQLATIREFLSGQEGEGDGRKNVLVKERAFKLDAIAREEAAFVTRMEVYLQSDEVVSFVKRVSAANAQFRMPANRVGDEMCVSIGECRMDMPLLTSMNAAIEEAFCGIFDAETSAFFIPYFVDFSRKSVFIFEYTNVTESLILGGLQHWILNLIKYQNRHCDRVCFFDPIRFNNTAMGCVAQIMGDGCVIDDVCKSKEQIRSKVQELLEDAVETSAKGMGPDYQLLVFHDFPHAYEADLQNKIQQLAVNAENYHVRVVLTQNTSINQNRSEIVEFLKSHAVYMKATEKDFALYCEELGRELPFTWYPPVALLPSAVEDVAKRAKKEKNLDNIYQNRVDIRYPNFTQKGIRKVMDIPIAVNDKGDVVTIDFENTNFAAFVCGASRSGKSTLLHTIITGLLTNNHPDDIEIWLIDFKMTEFSRYIENTPPHIRYIALDESPELVYDIIDRLSSILIQRQNLFKGKWEKLKDVPVEKYMPTIFVIIDEFSIMSNVLADTAGSNDNYVIKLQNIMSRGAAFGFKFIFASQGFDNGTRGLNDFSKNQIQQRIAMKTDFEEVKSTLALKSISERDKLLMETLPVFHVLLKHDPDSQGNRIDLSKVLFLSDKTIQTNLIKQMNTDVKPVKVFDPTDINTYIYKQPLFIDGNKYLSFETRSAEFRKYLQTNMDELTDMNAYAFSIGEPRRMKPIYPIRFMNEFSENMLVIGMNNEKMPIASIFKSMVRSAEQQQLPVYLWGKPNIPVYRMLSNDVPTDRCAIGLDAICEQIKKIKSNIRRSVQNDGLYFLFGFDSLLTEMEYANQTDLYDDERGTAGPEMTIVYEARKPGESDILTLLGAADEFKEVTDWGEAPSVAAQPIVAPAMPAAVENTGAYDAREDLRFILTNGPKKGYHFVMLYNTGSEFRQSRLNNEVFKHKVLFRTSRDGALEVVGGRDSSLVAELIPHTFRYTDGMDGLNFRPFIHEGLTWDGWKYRDGEAISEVDEEETYLM